MKRMVTVMSNKAKKDTTSKHSMWSFFTELPLGCQLILVFDFCSLLVIPIILGIIKVLVSKFLDREFLDGEFLLNTAEIISIVFIFVIVIAFILAYSFLIRYDKEKNVKIDPCELVKELESFWIEEDDAEKLANEFLSDKLKTLIRKDYLFSPTHYRFLYNSLKKYIKDKCPDALDASFFLNASIHKKENFSDEHLLSFAAAIVLAFLFGYSGSKGFIDSANTWSAFIIIIILMSCLSIIAIFRIQIIGHDKRKLAFHLSILNQLKKDINVEKSKASKAPGQISTTDLSSVGNESDDNVGKSQKLHAPSVAWVRKSTFILRVRKR